MTVATDQPPGLPGGSPSPAPPLAGTPPAAAVSLDGVTVEYGKNKAVSYTHLTLPTILRV